MKQSRTWGDRTHLPLQCQRGLSIIARRSSSSRRLTTEEPIAPLVYVPSSVDTRSVRSMDRQVAQRHVLEERGHRRRTDLHRIRRIRGDDMRPVKTGVSRRPKRESRRASGTFVHLFEPQTNSLSVSSFPSPTRAVFAVVTFWLEGKESL